jgi:DNA-binding PadR family transcriptional regulator
MPKKEKEEKPAWTALSIGLFIRDYLLENGRAYPYEIYRAIRGELREKSRPIRGLKRGSYQNIRNYFYWLTHLGLIEPEVEVPSEKPYLKDRRYYRLTAKGRRTPPHSLEWLNPRRALYPESWEACH